MKTKLLWTICILLVIWRLFITPRLNIPTSTGFHEATAHIFVGWLLGRWYELLYDEAGHAEYMRPRYLAMAIFITLAEIIIYGVQKLSS